MNDTSAEKQTLLRRLVSNSTRAYASRADPLSEHMAVRRPQSNHMLLYSPAATIWSRLMFCRAAGSWTLKSCAWVRPVNKCFPLSRSAVLWHTIVLSFIDRSLCPHIISRAIWKTCQHEHEVHSATDSLFAFMKLYVLALSYGGMLEQDI